MGWNPWTPHGVCGVHQESRWNPGGNRQKFGWAPCQINSTWTPGGLHESTWIPGGMTRNLWGSVKSSMFGRPLSRSLFELWQLHLLIPWNFLIIYQYLMLLKRHLIYLVIMEPFMLLSLIHVQNAPILIKQQWISIHPFLQ